MIVIGFDTSSASDPHCAWRRLLDSMLSRFMSLDDITVYKDENGKPRSSEACFSVSHSRDVVMCALFVPGQNAGELPVISAYEHIDLTDSTAFFAIECAKCADLGTDTEFISPRRSEARLRALSERYFTPEEISLVDKYGKSAFYRIWTEKESYLKLSGVGLKAIRTANTLSLTEGISMLSFAVSHNGEEFSCSVCFQNA